MSLFLAALLGLSMGSAQAKSVDRIAAVVNDDVITLSEVYELGREFIDARAQAGDVSERRIAELEVLDTLIRRRLVEQTAVELQIDATAEDVDRAERSSQCSQHRRLFGKLIENQFKTMQTHTMLSGVQTLSSSRDLRRKVSSSGAHISISDHQIQ